MTRSNIVVGIKVYKFVIIFQLAHQLTSIINYNLVAQPVCI